MTTGNGTAMSARFTGLRPIEKNGLRGFGFSIHFDTDNQSAAHVLPRASNAGEVAPPASPAPIPRPVTFSGSGGEPSTPTSDELSTGPSASADGCGLKSLEAATNHDEATK